MTIPTVYKSTDAGAPVLNGQAGSLITLLDAVLVNGYGAKAAAGWTKPFNGVNQGSYKSTIVGTGIGMILGVVDNAPNPTLANGREARLRGYEAQTALNVGTGLFPTVAQIVNPVMRKSATNDATARPWTIVADDRTFYLFVNTGDYGNGYAAMAFGEFYSLKSTADAYRCMIIARVVEQLAVSPTPLASGENLNLLGAFTSAVTGHYVPRTFSEFPQSAVQVGKHGNAAHSGSSLTGLMMYPNPVDGGLYLAPLTLHEQASGVGVARGRLRGLWHFLHPAASAVNDGDTFAGAGAMAGKNFLVVKPGSDGTSVFVIETSNTWETN